MANSHTREWDSIGPLIREAREKKRFTQEELGDAIGVSTRSVNDWECGRSSPSAVHKQALVECLEIDAELLGATQQHNFTDEDVAISTKRTKFYLNAAMFNSAYMSSDFLVRNLRRQVKQGDMALLRPLIDAHHLAGHTVSIARNNAELALRYYQRMEHYIHRLEEDDHERTTLLSLSRTYQGEMYRRQGRMKDAVGAFERAPQGPDVDVLVRGNRAQLYARTYADTHEPEMAIRQLDRSFDLLNEVPRGESGMYVSYTLCGTHIEYSQFFFKRQNIEESMRSIERAEQCLPASPARWRIPVLINKGKLLLYSGSGGDGTTGFAMGRDFDAGMDLLEEAIDLTYNAGHVFQLAKIAAIKKQLFHQSKAYLDAAYRLDKKLDDHDKLTRTIVN